MRYLINNEEVSKQTFDYYMELMKKTVDEKRRHGTLLNHEKENHIYKGQNVKTLINNVVFERDVENTEKRVRIAEFTYLVEKKLGFDGLFVSKFIDKYLETTYPNKVFGRMFRAVDVAKLRTRFLSLLDLEKLNPLDYKSFLEHTDSLMTNGSKSFTRNSESIEGDYIRFVVNR